ncbi:MAG: hypothetical protein ACI9U2_002186 [Bradymonadia bacterium]|jgi:hypothetical protein
MVSATGDTASGGQASSAKASAIWGDVICRLGLRPSLDAGHTTVFEGERNGVAIRVGCAAGVEETGTADGLQYDVCFSRPAPDVPGGAHRFRAVPRAATPVLSTLTTGDIGFDALVTLFGDPGALWLLDDDVRAAIVDAVHAGAWVTGSQAGLPHGALSSCRNPAEVLRQIDRVCAALLRLTRPRSIGELIAGASTDAAMPVRRALAEAVSVRLTDDRAEAQISAARNIATHLPDQSVTWLGVLTRQTLSNEAVLAVIDAVSACVASGSDTHLDDELVAWLDRHQAIAVQQAAQQALSGVVRQLIVSMRGPERDARIRRLIAQASTRGALVEAICSVLVEDQLPNASDWLGLLHTDDPHALVVVLQAWGRVPPSAPGPIIAFLEHGEPQVRIAAAETLAVHVYAHLTANRWGAAHALAAYAAQSPEFCRAAAHVCVRARPARAVDWLAAVPVDAAADPGTAQALAEAFEGLGDARAEARLLEWLGADDPARIAVIEALGTVGTRAAIQPLSELAKGFLIAGAARRAAKAAIESIESRAALTAAVTNQPLDASMSGQ